jgi:hypothetical protein
LLVTQRHCHGNFEKGAQQKQYRQPAIWSQRLEARCWLVRLEGAIEKLRRPGKQDCRAF